MTREKDFIEAAERLAETKRTEDAKQQCLYDFGIAADYGYNYALQHPQWIPVEEELPPKGMEVLAWGITKPVEKGKLSFCDVFYSWRMDHKPLFYDEVDENGFCLYSLGSRSDHRGFKITHWMPLPPAPRKEE